MYSARLMLAWLPTGSGAPKESAYWPFLEALTDGARAQRRARAIKYEVQRIEREHKDVAAELDGARLERLKYQRQCTVPGYLDGALQDLSEGFRSRTVKLDQLRPRVDAAKKEARAIAVRVYALKPSVTNATQLLEDDRKQEQLAESGSTAPHRPCRARRAHDRFRDAIDRRITARIDTHRIALENWSVLKARTERRDLDQWLYEEEMFLDVVAPVLEADGRIAEDRLRSSNLGRDQSGERRVFQRGPDPSPLTPDQENRYFVDFDAWWDECDKQAAVLARLTEHWAGVLQSLGTSQSDTASNDLRKEWEEDCRVAQERLIEAQRYLRQRSYELVDRCAVPPLFEFFDDPDDREDSEPTTEERLRLGAPDMDAVDRWKALVWESHPPPSAMTRGFLDSWPWKPLELGEPGAYDGYWLEEDEKWLRDRLIRNCNNVSDEIRLGMAIAGSSRITRLLQRIGLIRPQL
ncbi:hypothetical protein LTR17_004584 [Elasticomyces elasticus]|nr:hypothetical protein LTR17_004584 [Elasticomyces elasticus]